MRKIYTSLLLVVLFWGAGNAQDYVRLNHFPFAYNTDVEEIEFFNTSPFTTLFAKYKIKELHELYVFKGFNDSAQTVYYFNEKGETDSILIFYDFQHQKTKYWKYSLKYNENGKATRFEYTLFDSDTIVHDPALIFVEYEGNIPVRSIHIFNNCENKFDTVICQYYYFPEREYPWERLEIEYIIKDTCLSKDEYMNKCYQLPLYLFEKENQDSVLLTTDEYGSTLYFFNKNHKIISELVFSRWTEEPILENYMNYTWKFNGILESCISSMNKYGCNTDTFCMVAFNENNLPLVFESRIEKFNFKYIYDEKLYRWSDCNFGNKAETEEWVDFIEKEIDNNEKVHFYEKSGTFYYKPYSSDSILLKKSDPEGSYWFRNDYLIKADFNNGHTFWYEKDTLVGYELYPKPRKVNHQKILKEAAEVMNRLQDEISQIDKYFGLRIHISGYYPILSKPIFNNTITIKRSELENLKEISCNKPGYKIISYEVIFANWAGDLLTLPVEGNIITEQVMKYLQSSRKRLFLENIKVVDINGEPVREFHLVINVIDY